MVMHYLTALSTLSEFLPVAIFMTPGSVSAPNSRQQGNEDTGKSNNLYLPVVKAGERGPSQVRRDTR